MNLKISARHAHFFFMSQMRKHAVSDGCPSASSENTTDHSSTMPSACGVPVRTSTDTTIEPLFTVYDSLPVVNTCVVKCLGSLM